MVHTLQEIKALEEATALHCGSVPLWLLSQLPTGAHLTKLSQAKVRIFPSPAGVIFPGCKDKTADSQLKMP